MKAWEDFLALQEKKVGRAAVDQWLRPLRVVRFDACNLYLEARDSFQALWFEEHIRHQVQQHLLNKNRRRIRVHLEVAKEDAEEAPEPVRERSHQFEAFTLRFDHLDPNLTFDNFLVTSGNELAYKLLTSLCKCDGAAQDNREMVIEPATFNPIFVHGPSGTGKSHLLMASARRLRQAGLRTLYVRAETFAEHVVTAIRLREMEHFRTEYRKCDALLIDDIQVLARKGATQEEFFHTFNTLHVERKQLILSANCAPQELKSVEARLISRFEWGIVVPLNPLGNEELEQVLRHRAEVLNFPLRDEVARWMLATFSRTPKTLIGTLEALVLRSHLESSRRGLDIDRMTAESYLADLIEEERHHVATPERIIDLVADYYGVTTLDILGKSQTREISLPRKVAMYLCRTHLSLPLKRIGDIFSRDHSTVLSSIRQIKGSLDKNREEIKAALTRVIKAL